MKLIIPLGFAILLGVAGLVTAQLQANETRPATVADYDEIAELAGVTRVELDGYWLDLDSQSGRDTMTITVAERNDRIFSVITSTIKDDQLYFSSAWWDTEVPQDEWLSILHGHIFYIAQQAKLQGATTMQASLVEGTWAYAYSEILMRHGAYQEGSFRKMSIRDFERVRIDTTQILNATDNGFIIQQYAEDQVQATVTREYIYYPSADIYIQDWSDDTGDWHLNFSGIQPIPAGETYTSATLWLYYYDIDKTDSSSVYWKPNIKPWNETSGIGANCHVYDNSSPVGGAYDTITVTKDANGWYDYGVTSAVANLFTSGQPWYGQTNMTFYLPQENSNNCYVVTHDATLQWKPYNGKNHHARSRQSASPPMLIIKTTKPLPTSTMKAHMIVNPNHYAEFNDNSIIRM